MFCEKCGYELPDDSLFCANCGASVSVEKTIDRVKKKNSAKTSLIILIACLVVGMSVFFAYNEIGKAKLKSVLLQDWSRIEIDNDSCYTLVLDFSDNQIDYNFESTFSWMDSTIATYEYKVISPKKIVVSRYGFDSTITIRFNEDKTMMTMIPAITNTDSQENWFLH